MNTGRIAKLLRELADEIEAPAAEATPATIGPQLEVAQKLSAEIQLNRALHVALHRYHPAAPTAQA